MGRIINSPMPWKYPMPVRAIEDDDIFVCWHNMRRQDYERMLKRFKKENGYEGDEPCPTSTQPSASK